MAIPPTSARPISDVLSQNNFKFTNVLISSLSDLINRAAGLPAYITAPHAAWQLPNFALADLQQIITDLGQAQANIKKPKIKASKLSIPQITQINNIAKLLFKQQQEYEYDRARPPAGGVANESPFGIRVISKEWLQDLSEARVDNPNLIITNIVRKYRDKIDAIFDDTTKEDASYKSHITPDLQQYLIRYDLNDSLFTGDPKFLKFLTSSEEEFPKLYGALEEKEKSDLKKLMKQYGLKSPDAMKEWVADFFWWPETATKAAAVFSLLHLLMRRSFEDSYTIPTFGHCMTYGILGCVYTKAHADVLKIENGRIGELKKEFNTYLAEPFKWCRKKIVAITTIPSEIKNCTVSFVNGIPVIGHAIRGSKWAKVTLMVAIPTLLLNLSLSSYANYIPDLEIPTPTLNILGKNVTLINTTSLTNHIPATIRYLPDLVTVPFSFIKPFLNVPSAIALLSASYIYQDEFASAKAKIIKVKTAVFGNLYIPNPVRIITYPFQAIVNICPSFIASRLKKKAAATIFAPSLSRETLPHGCKLFDDPKYSPSIQQAASFVHTATSPISIFLGACKELVEQNISHPEVSKTAITRFCQANRFSTESVGSFASALSTGEAILNWGAKIPVLNVTMGMLRSQIGVATAVSGIALGGSMMVVGSQITKDAGAAIIREFTVQGAANIMRGFVETYFYLLSLVLTIPWDVSGRRLSILGATASPLHVPLAMRHIVDEMQKTHP